MPSEGFRLPTFKPLAGLSLLLGMALLSPLHAQTVTLEVRFKLTDLEYRPIAGEKVRVVIGTNGDWQMPGSGHACTTDAQGEARFTTQANLDRRWRRPSGALPPALPSLPQATDHLLAAAELVYAGHRWLYAVDLCRFQNGDVLLDAFEVYTLDQQGRFSLKASHHGLDWRMADLGGLMLTGPGHEPWEYRLEPMNRDSKPQKWHLNLSFKRAPAPVMR